MSYCTQCGYALRGDAVFCPACGIRLPEPEPTPDNHGVFADTCSVCEESQVPGEAAEAAPEAVPEDLFVPQKKEPIPAPLAPRPDTPVITGYSDNALPRGSYAVLGTGGFFLNRLLFLIPVVGLISAILMACFSRNANRRNDARGALILRAVLYFTVIAAVAVVWLLVSSGILVWPWAKELIDMLV